MRFAKPLDAELILDSLEKCRALFTLEEHVLTGGFGSKVLECLERYQVSNAVVERCALPDEFTPHGSREKLLDGYGLSAEKMAGRILERLKTKFPMALQ